MKRPTLHQINNGLSVIVVGLCLYVLLAPFWPQASQRWQKEPSTITAEKQGKPEPPQENTLVIPKINLQQTIHESQDQSALSKGIWRIPSSNSPDSGGNTVLTGHRFTYGGSSVLYHLDKVRPGDEIIVYWQQRKHVYRVANVLVVPPNTPEILRAEPDEDKLTIYTCTPLVTARNRLVIQAVPIPEGGQTP